MMICKSFIYTCACIAVHATCGPTAVVLFAGVLLYYDSSDIHNIIGATVAMLITLEPCEGAALLLRWAACGAWTCLYIAIGAHDAAHVIVVLLGMLLVAPSSWLREEVQLIAILMDQKNSSATVAIECGDYNNYPPFIFRTIVYLLLTSSSDEETARVRMLRYGATLFATNTPMLAVAGAVLVAARPSQYRRLQQAAAFRSMMQSAVASFLKSEESPQPDDAQPQMDKAL